MLESERAHDAFEEYKRIDHLIHVTLKYTRTVDILRSVLLRIVSTIELMSVEVTDWAVAKKKIARRPSVPLLCVQEMEKVFPGDDGVKDIIDFYVMVRNITKSEYKKKEEFRKNVALVTKDKEINIEVLKDYSEKTKRYINYLKTLID